MNQEAINKSIESIEIAFEGIEFLYRFQSVDPQLIKDLFRCDLEIKEVRVEGKNLDTEDVNRFILNRLNEAICCFWIAVDEALDKVFGNKLSERDSDLDNFRSVIYMFRCAFTHEISEPKWDVRNPVFRRHPYQLKVPVECQRAGVDEFYFDFNKLNGQNLKTEEYKHFRGLFTFSLMALQLLKDAEAKIFS